MHTFSHTTENTFKVKPTNLPAAARLEEKTIKGELAYVVQIDETLTVPTTAAELRQVAADDLAEVEIECDGVKIKATQAAADYIRGRKLRSNQEQGARLRGGGVTERRGNALAFWSKIDTAQLRAASDSFIRSMQDREYARVHNAKLDRITALLAEGKLDEAEAEAVK